MLMGRRKKEWRTRGLMKVTEKKEKDRREMVLHFCIFGVKWKGTRVIWIAAF
jgi:hypothetical protein